MKTTFMEVGHQSEESSTARTCKSAREEVTRFKAFDERYGSNRLSSTWGSWYENERDEYEKKLGLVPSWACVHRL